MLVKVVRFTISVAAEHTEETKRILEENYVRILDIETSMRHNLTNLSIIKDTRFECETSMEQCDAVCDRLNETSYPVWLHLD